MVCRLPDVITYAKFQVEIFRGYDFTGVEFPIFLLIFAWALQQCSATALPVIQPLSISLTSVTDVALTQMGQTDISISIRQQNIIREIITTSLSRITQFNLCLICVNK